MKYYGKEKCKILKQIRAEIARQNDIEWVVSECQHQGNCRGTCPRCEYEVRQLEEAIARREALGKKVAVVGISAGIALSVTGCDIPLMPSVLPTGGEPMAETDVLMGDVQIPDGTEIAVLEGEVAVPDIAEVTDEQWADELAGKPLGPEETFEEPLDGVPFPGEPLPEDLIDESRGELEGEAILPEGLTEIPVETLTEPAAPTAADEPTDDVQIPHTED